MNNKHGYAKQFLNSTPYEIYKGEEKILEYDGSPNYDVPTELVTEIELGQPINDEGVDIKSITAYSDLVNMGYIITSRKAEQFERTFRGQAKIYELAKKESNKSDVGQIPPEHYVQWDMINKQIRLIGKNAGVPGRIAKGEWITLANKRNTGVSLSNRGVGEYFSKSDKIIDNILGRWAPVEEEREYVKIPETVIMISEANEIVCIEHNSGDPPVIGIVGTRGGGKTVCLHNIADQVFYKTADPRDPTKGHRIVFCNDRQQQLFSWCMPSTSQGWINEMQALNHYPAPLPTVFLYPNDFDLGDIDIQHGRDLFLSEDEGVSHRITLPYKGIIDNYKYFFEGRKNWDLGGSERYFKQLRKLLRECTTLAEIKDILYEHLGGGEKKGLKGTINKIYAVMEDLFETELIDVNSKHPSKWKVFKKGKEVGEYFPITALLAARLIPVIENAHLYTKEYYPQYMRFFIQDIYENLINKRMPYNDRTWLMIDEIGQIYKKNKKRTVAAEALIDTFTEGRKPNIASAYTLQSWDQVDDEIQLNTNFVIAFTTNQTKDLSELGKAFDLKKYVIEDIKRLKTFECVAMTTRRFKVYDQDGNSYYTDQPIKGKIVKPMSEHTKPS